MMHSDYSISSNSFKKGVQFELSQSKVIYQNNWPNLTFLCPHDRQSLDNGQPFLGEGELKPAVMSRHLSSIWSRWACTTPTTYIQDYIMHTFDCSLAMSRQCPVFYYYTHDYIMYYFVYSMVISIRLFSS